MNRISTKLATTSAGDMYQLFVKELLKEDSTLTAKRWKHIPNGEVYTSDGKVYITYSRYKDILAEYNQRAGEKIIRGYTLDLMNGLGNLFVARIERGKGNTRLNIKESLKLKARLEQEGKIEGTNWQVPYTDDDFIGIIWHKGNGLINNIKLYKFKTAGGQPGKGFRAALSRYVRSNINIKAAYPFLPSKRLTFIENTKEPKNGI